MSWSRRLGYQLGPEIVIPAHHWLPLSLQFGLWFSLSLFFLAQRFNIVNWELIELKQLAWYSKIEYIFFFLNKHSLNIMWVPASPILLVPPILFLTKSRNSTLLSSSPETYWGQFEEISKYNTHLSIIERLWTAWYAWMQNDVLATGIMSFMMHELVYFGRSLPWIFIDSLGVLKNYKIQSVSEKK